MNKPAYAYIQSHSPTKPVLIFVSSRRQTRITALDLISYASQDDNPSAFLGMSEREVQDVLLQGMLFTCCRYFLILHSAPCNWR